MKANRKDEGCSRAASEPTISRRNLLVLLGAAGAGAVATGAQASTGVGEPEPGKANAVLVDTTVCAGCRACEVACAESHDLPAPEKPGDAKVFDQLRETGPNVFTVVNRATKPGSDGSVRYAKSQCFHCLSPACASACPVRALEKTPGGPVVYHKNRCIGCRYCMVACPFGVPKYQYEKPFPYVRKCDFCFDRQKEGLPSACASVCPTGALTFGRRDELLETARKRIWGTNDPLQRKIFGEHEAGGTSWMYLSDLPPADLRLPDKVSNDAYSELTAGALSAVPAILTLWPPLLMGLYTAAKKRDESGGENSTKGVGHE
jgi:Fe-S-cluster-containing dehydrogenase component